jgi:hypothetical protein
VDKPAFNHFSLFLCNMAYEAIEFDATLAAAAGDDAVLAGELRAVFAESVARQVDLLRRARCDGNWQVAALRLKGVAASFHARPLIDLADEAFEGVPGEPGIIRRIQGFLDDFGAHL